MEPDAGDERERHEGHRGEEEEPASKRNGRHDRVAVRRPSGGAEGGNPSDHPAHYGIRCRHSPRWVRRVNRSRRTPPGRDFTRPTPESLVLGKTTYAEINGRFGSPYRESTVIKNEKTLRMASYAYATAGGDHHA
jgi:hypothetical protein